MTNDGARGLQQQDEDLDQSFTTDGSLLVFAASKIYCVVCGSRWCLINSLAFWVCFVQVG